MSGYVAPEKREPLQGLLHKRQVCRGGAAPSCLRKTALWLESPTGAFIAAQTLIPPFHSLFSGEPWFLFASMARCAAFGVIGTALCEKEKQKRDMQLDHLRAPIFVFYKGNDPLSRLRRQLSRRASFMRKYGKILLLV